MPSSNPSDSSSDKSSDLCSMIVLRHAEKDSGPDPALTEEGHQRAKALAQLMAGVQVDRMYCTEYLRTRQTLEPLSSEVGTPIEVVPAEDAPRWRSIVASIQPKEIVVICGHQNTVPLFIEEVGGRLEGLDSYSGQLWIPGHVYDRLYMATWQYSEGSEKPHPQLIELRYGKRC